MVTFFLFSFAAFGLGQTVHLYTSSCLFNLLFRHLESLQSEIYQSRKRRNPRGSCFVQLPLVCTPMLQDIDVSRQQVLCAGTELAEHEVGRGGGEGA